MMNMDRGKGSEGVTILELIIVIAILATLGGVVVPVYSGYIQKAREAKDLQVLNVVNTAIGVVNVFYDDVVIDAELFNETVRLIWGPGDNGIDDGGADEYIYLMGNNDHMKITYYADVTVVDGLVVGVDP